MSNAVSPRVATPSAPRGRVGLDAAGARLPNDARLIAAATEAIRHGGAKRLTVVAVAEAAGMSHPNVYRYFPSKTALVDAVSSEWTARVEADLANIAGAPDPADDKLERMMLALARASRERLEEEPRLFDAYVDAVEKNRHVARKHRLRVFALLERVLEEGLANETFEASDRARALSLVLDCLHRFLNPLTVQRDADMPRRTLDDRLAVAIRAVLRALSHGIA